MSSQAIQEIMNTQLIAIKLHFCIIAFHNNLGAFPACALKCYSTEHGLLGDVVYYLVLIIHLSGSNHEWVNPPPYKSVSRSFAELGITAKIPYLK